MHLYRQQEAIICCSDSLGDTFKLVSGEIQGSGSRGVIAHIEDEIAFEQSRGNDTGELKSFLAILEEYQGYSLQSNVTVTTYSVFKHIERSQLKNTCKHNDINSKRWYSSFI
ncbi:hypothetical protein [Pseudoalteromonas luteoviolacea]|uniref:hypothetical protein n=1 Tax=Pseudoalteromonas luteoviolacea TaxID=43657 RepID=UPI001B394967|nr:hypothetical protein [Pseudoalteromonas luteoviolacea]MBQ4837738.1 hypothetical protein [Pseudoalteromonas luteoviolacea]